MTGPTGIGEPITALIAVSVRMRNYPAQKISGHHGAISTRKIASALAAARETASSTRSAPASCVQVKPPR